VTADYLITMTYICYHHKIIPENYFALTADGQLLYSGRCVDVPRLPRLELVECSPQSPLSTTWELKKQGPVWGSLRLHQATGGESKEWCVAQVGTLAVASELWGQGGTLYPQVQDLYPLYPQVKDAAYVKILSKRR